MANAQKNDTSKVVNIDLTAKTYFHNKTDTGEFDRFVGDAVFIQGTDTLYCDSLYKNSTTKNMEAFGDVKVHQFGGTQAQSDYLRYTSNTKLAYMRSNVILTDGKNNLHCQELTYDLGTKIGVYDNGGTLKTDSTTVTSKEGEYRVKEKVARFKKQVVVTDVRYNIVSDDLGYNTDNKLVTFFAPSVVTSDSGKSKLKTSNGTYDSRTGTAHFIGHSSVFNGAYYLEADSIYYNKLTGYGYANEHVIFIDTGRKSKLYCAHLEYFKFKRVMWATGKPVMEQVNGKDTLYMRADTFYSYPDPNWATIKEQRRLYAIEDSTRLAIINLDHLNNRYKFMTLVNGSLSIENCVDDNNTYPIPLIQYEMNYDYVGMLRPPLIATTIQKPEVLKTVDSSVSIQDSLGDVNNNAIDFLDFLKYKNANADTSPFSLVIADNTEPPLPMVQADITMPDGMPVIKIKDTSAIKHNAIQENENKIGKITNPIDPKSDTTKADTTAPLIFIGYHHVLIFSDSLQGKCDSITYVQADSIIKMIYDPIAWSHKSQITGDTILLKMDDSGKLKYLYVPNNSLVVSQSGPIKAQLYDQVQGKTLTGYFVKNTISKLVVVPNAESIYFSKDAKGAYIGESEAKSERMKIYFVNQEINKILFERDVTQTMTPLEKLDIPNARLSRFKWLIDQCPKSKKELFE